MTRLTRDDLKTLMEKRTGLCVSLFLPTHRAMPETQQDPIRLKNLLNEAERRLVTGGLRSPEAKELLQPAQRLLDDSNFWRYQSDGLALFLSSSGLRHYRLPISFAELAIVADRFYLKPLLQLLSDDGRIYILAVSQKEVRLLEGSRYGADEIQIEKLPEGMADILAQYDFEKQLQFHTRAPSTGGGRAAVFHGQGRGADLQRERIIQYFRRIDAALRDALKDERTPMVFAGVDYLFPIYKEVNTYQHLLSEIIPGNPEPLGPKELQAFAWRIAQPVFSQAREEAAAKFHSLAGTGLAGNRLEEVVPAAYHGRVESLFVAVGAQQWGIFDPEKNHVRLHKRARLNSEDLLDLAALRTLTAGGTVYTVEPDKLPSAGVIAAVFRY